MVTSPEKRWRARPGGGTARRDPDLNQGEEDEEGLESGDCDDEDECAGVSGLGPPTRRKRLRIFAGQLHSKLYSFKCELCCTYLSILYFHQVCLSHFHKMFKEIMLVKH